MTTGHRDQCRSRRDGVGYGPQADHVPSYREVTIARINEISRPDNLAMIRYLRTPMLPLTDKLKASYSHLRWSIRSRITTPPLRIPFSIVIDHHPAVFPTSRGRRLCGHPAPVRRGEHIAHGVPAGLPTSGPASGLPPPCNTASVRIPPRLPRTGTEIDCALTSNLAAHRDTALLTRITRSEYLPEWLKYFARAFSSMHQCGSGAYCYLDTVENPDILVVVADSLRMFTSIKWVGVCGVYNDTVVCHLPGRRACRSWRIRRLTSWCAR